jgi:hypothetical protein
MRPNPGIAIGHLGFVFVSLLDGFVFVSAILSVRVLPPAATSAVDLFGLLRPSTTDLYALRLLPG